MKTTRIQPLRTWRFLFGALLPMFFMSPADAADVSLTMSVSPELAYAVREWRREHGLPQDAEAHSVSSQRIALADNHRAIDKALRLVGLDAASRDDLDISAQRTGSHWQVSIKVRGDESDGGYMVEVADSVVRQTHAVGS